MPRALSVCMLLGACLALTGLGAALGADEEMPSPLAAAPDPLYVETAVVRAVPDDPEAAELYVTGQLPTPCHEATWAVEPGAGRTDVTLWSTPQADTLCVAVLEPVALAIPLGALDPHTMVVLNGETVEAAPDAGDGVSLAGAGWSFGMCRGYCAADLEIAGEAVALSGRDREQREPVFVNRGVLTAEGAARVAAAAAATAGSVLEPVYGCPDCADGGAAYLLLSGAEGVHRHDMEFGAPPEPLAPLYEVAMAISLALESCGPSELVTVDDTCEAYLPPAG